VTQQRSALSARRWKAARRIALVTIPAWMATGWASAQVATPSPEALNKADAKAQRESEKVFKWILINADRPKHATPEAKPAAAAPAAAPKAVAKAHEPKDEGIVEKVEPIQPRGAAPAPAQKALAKSAPAPGPGTAPVEQAAARPAPAGNALPSGGPALAEQAPAPSAAATAQAAASAPTDQLALAAPKAKAPQVPPPAAEEEEDEQLQLVKQVDPEFPRSMIERLEKGAVQVKFDVNPDGTVSSPSVVKTSHPRLNDAAIAAVSQWRFKPLHHKQTGIVELKFDLSQ
jgi:TonB family protein